MNTSSGLIFTSSTRSWSQYLKDESANLVIVKVYNSLSFDIPGQQFDGGFVHVEPLQQGVVSEFNELADGLSESFSIRLPSAADV